MSLLSKWSSLGHKVATQKTEPQNVSLLNKWSSLGHKVATQKTEPQNLSLLGKWSSLGHKVATQKTGPSKNFMGPKQDLQKILQGQKGASKCVTFEQMVQFGTQSGT